MVVTRAPTTKDPIRTPGPNRFAIAGPVGARARRERSCRSRGHIRSRSPKVSRSPLRLGSTDISGRRRSAQTGGCSRFAFPSIGRRMGNYRVPTVARRPPATDGSSALPAKPREAGAARCRPSVASAAKAARGRRLPDAAVRSALASRLRQVGCATLDDRTLRKEPAGDGTSRRRR